jgi:two-component system, cell cycle sensor histidine kinase and response regulator CckA
MKLRHQLSVLLFFFGVSIYLFYAGYDTVKTEMIRDLNLRQTAHAKQAAKGIESFFNHYLSDLKFLSQIDSIIDLDDRGRDLMRIFHDNNSNEIHGVTRVDAHGRILGTYPDNQQFIGVDISSQDHIREIMKTHQPVVSDVFLAVQGF